MNKMDEEKYYVVYIDGIPVKKYPPVLPAEYYDNMELQFLKLSIQISISKIRKKYC